MRHLVEVFTIIQHCAYRRDDSDDEAWAVIPGRRSGGSPSSIGISDERIARLLERLDQAAGRMGDHYLARLERALRNEYEE
jgi:hypothetical protein